MSLAAPGLESFEFAARELAARITAASKVEDKQALLDEAFAALSSSDLDLEEVTHRATRLTSMLDAEDATLEAVAAAARGSGAAVRSGAAEMLPAHWMQALYDETQPGPGTSDADDSLSAEPGTTGSDSGFEESVRPAVLLLGAPDATKGNATVLGGKGFDVVRVSSFAELDAVEDGGCGVVIHETWWRQFEGSPGAPDRLAELLDKATIPFYRVDASGFGEAEARAISELLEGHEASRLDGVQVGVGCELGDFDFERLAKIADLLESSEGAGVAVEGLTDGDRRLLAAAISLFEREAKGEGTPPLELTMMPLPEGRSGARVYRVRTSDPGSVYVAKLDDIERLQAELKRARAVAPPSQQFQMGFYSIAGLGVLLQRLHEQLDKPLFGAPTLRERLELYSRGESGSDDPTLDAGALATGLDRLVRGISDLRQPAKPDLGQNAWLACEPIEALAANGIAWHVDELGGRFDPADLLPWIKTVVGRRKGEALVHGDLHTSNVVMLDDQTPRLIDYAQGGCGHPCFDHVRLASAVAFEFLRPVLPEEELRGALTELHVDGAPPDDLAERHPELVAGSVAPLVIKLLTDCRAAALAGVDGEDGEVQYLATVYLIGLQSLTVSQFQAATVRASLGAVRARLIETRNAESAAS